MADAVNSEGETGGSSDRGGWRKLMFWRHSEQDVSPKLAQEAPVIPEGYRELIETYKLNPELNSSYIARLLEQEYPTLRSEIEAGNVPDIKSVLMVEVNNGNMDVIAVVMSRFLKRLQNNKVPSKVTEGQQALAKEMERNFVEKRLAEDETARMESIKKDWARGAFREAVNTPLWKPTLSTPIPAQVSNAFKDQSLNPIPATKSLPPQR